MMKTKILLPLLLLSFTLFSQISTNEQPIGLRLNLHERATSKGTVKTLSKPNIDTLLKEDKIDEEKGLPPRFGYKNKVNYNLLNSGIWTTLKNGDKLWRLNIKSTDALSINLLYDKFWLPKGGKLFIYSKDGKHSIGAFTSRNNKGKDKQHIRGFATGLVYSDDIIVEYYQPAYVKDKATISIAYVVHGYRYLNFSNISHPDFNSSASCNININCPEGQDWQKEKEAVALIIVDGNQFCTGSLINTTAKDLSPLFLTAEHCLNSYDAVTNPNLDYFSFYWHYELPNCSNSNIKPREYSTSGAKVIANNSPSDFALLELNEDPLDLPFFTPYYFRMG